MSRDRGGITAALAEMTTGGARRIANSMQAAGTSAAVKAGRAAAPKGKTKETSKSVGKRVVRRDKAGLIVSKIGINVGHRKASQVQKGEPHAHLAGAGTKPRYRKVIGGRFAYITRPTREQLSTGVMPANGFVSQAVDGAAPTIRAAMIGAGQKAVAREAARAAKKG